MKKYRLTCIAILFCLLLSACGKDEPAVTQLYTERGEAQREALGELRPAADADAVLQALAAAGQSESARWQPDDAETERGGPRLTVRDEAAGDTVVTDGTHIYMLDSYGLVTVSVAGAQSEVRAYTKVARDGDRWGERLCLWQDRIAVLWSNASYEEDGSWRGATETRAVVLSVADPAAPTQIAALGMDGSLLDACLIDGKLCVVTQKSLLTLPEAEQAETLLPWLSEDGERFALRAGDIYLCDDPSRAALSLAAEIDMENGRFVDALAFADGTEAVRPDGNTLYLARTRWDEESAAPRTEAPYTVVDYTTVAETEIKRLRVEDGLTLTDGCVLPGALSDPDALDVWNGQLRLQTEADERSFSIYTDEKHGWSNYEGKRHLTDSRLAVLDGDLNARGALAKLGGETGIQSCRFLNDTAWISAADTLSTVDLSDPANPQMRGSFAAAGDTLVLRDLGNGRVLSFALPVPGSKPVLTLYDVSDPAAPKVLDSLEPDELPAEDLSARNALFTDAANGLIGWTVVGEDRIEYRLVRCDDGKLRELGAFALEYVPENARALLLDGTLYLCSPGQVCVIDPETMKLIATVSNAVG